MVYIKPTFRAPGANYVSVCAPSLDGRFWGTEWEKKPDVELMNFPFSEDIVTNPYSGWWAGFLGPYYVNGVKVARALDHGENGTPTADEAFAKLPANLKPLPAMTPIAKGFSSIFEERRGKRVTLESDKKRKSYFREQLQHGRISECGDRFEFMRYHDWYEKIALNAFCADCGIDPNTYKKI